MDIATLKKLLIRLRSLYARGVSLLDIIEGLEDDIGWMEQMREEERRRNMGEKS